MAQNPTMPAAAARLIRRYYVYAGIYTLAASIIWGINTLFLLDAGLTIAQVFIANSAFSIGTILFEIPTGVVADTIGRRASFLLSLMVLALSTLAYVGLAAIDGGVLAFSAVSVLIGLGFTFYSGAMDAWLVDGVHELGWSGDMDGVFARAQVIGNIAMLVGTVGGGILGQIDLAIPFVVRAALLIALFGLAWFGMHDVGFTPRALRFSEVPAVARAVAVDGIVHGWSIKPLRLVMIASAIANGVFFYAWYAWQPYFLELLEQDAVWVAGVIAAALAVAMAIGNSLVAVFTRWCGRRTTLLMWSIAGFAAGLVATGVATNFGVAVGAFLFAAVAMGVYMPVRQAFVHELVDSSKRATVVSFDSMISGVGAFGGQAGLGVLSDRRGYSAAYILGGVITLVALPITWLARREDAEADTFAGTQSADPGCTPQGVPDIAQVEGRSVS